MLRPDAPARVRLLVARLRRLAERPGTPGEGAAARRALEEIERRYGLPLGDFRPTVEAVVSATGWVQGSRRARFRTEPFPSRARYLSARIAYGYGTEARRARARAYLEGRELSFGDDVKEGSVVEVRVSAGGGHASRVAVHLSVLVEGSGGVPRLSAVG